MMVTDYTESPIGPLRDPDLLVQRICEITQQSSDLVRERLRREHESIGTNVREAMASAGVPPYVWSDQLREFYEQTDAFLYETIVWNLTHEKCKSQRWILDYLRNDFGKAKKILTFGDGLGFDSYALAAAGHEVTYFEVSKPCAQFAASIFNNAGLNVEIVTDSEELEHRRFDTILCLDVLEHVPDPVGLVGWLSGLLVDNGRLISSAPFYYVNSTVPTHLKGNRRFSGNCRSLYRPAGLTAVGGRVFWNPIVLEKNACAAVPLRIRLGGMLLRIGQIWGWPFEVAAMVLLRRKHPLGFKRPHLCG
jgi:2-polyprenyl-3-methyl-5-hydroxy-6-metoxy-1,4-benzoquinol methylase